MDTLIVAIAGGLALGGTLTLISLGLVLGFRATQTLNFAHGQFMLLAAFIFGRLVATGSGRWWIALLISLGVMAVAGAAFYRLVLQASIGRPHYIGLIASLGVAALLDGFIGLFFGTTDQYVIEIPILPDGTISVAGVPISSASVVLTIFSFTLAGLVAALLHYTPTGIRVRAVGQDALLASQGGINVRGVYMGSWAVACVLAGVAGMTYGAGGVVNRSLVDVALLALPAMLLGGLDSITGAIVGGLIIGLVQGVVYSYVGGEAVSAISYTLLLLVMLFKPEGLFGTPGVVRA